MAAGVRQDRGDRHAGRRRAARRREPRHRAPRPGVALAAGRTPIGLRSLLDASGLTGKTIDSYQVAFILAPRVNAAGRMSTPDIATRLLLATDEAMGDEARGAGAAAERREPAAPAGRGRPRRAGEEGDRDRPGGRRAQRARRRRRRAGTAASSASPRRSSSTRITSPRSCCRSTATSPTARAAASRTSTCSARSSTCADVFLRFGGHKQAAGLTMEAARVPEFRARINAYADEVLEPDQLRPRLRIDGPLSLKAITPDLVRGLDAMGPFGMANPRPVFHASGGRDRRRPPHAQGAPPQDDLQPGRPPLPRHRLARRRTRRLPRPATAPASTSPSRSSATSSRAKPTSSSTSPTSKRSSDVE